MANSPNPFANNPFQNLPRRSTRAKTDNAKSGLSSIDKPQTEVLKTSGRSVKTRVLCSITGHLALMLEAGTPLLESLEAVANQSAGSEIGRVLQTVAQDVSGGNTLACALEAHPRVFTPFFISAIRAGESSGSLVPVLKRMEISLMRREAMGASIRAAMIYPAILTLLSGGAVVFIVAFVLPKFATIFETEDAVLPLPTIFLLGISDIFSSYWFFIIPAFIGLLIGIYSFVTSVRGKAIVDRYVLRVPILGPLVISFQTSVFLRMVGMLLSAGVPLYETMDMAEHACSNNQFKKAILNISSGILRGEGFSANFSQSDLFPEIIKQMMITGEKTGELSLVMNKMADYLDNSSEKGMKLLSAAIEPIIIIFMGVIVGFIAIAVMLPLFKLTSVVKGG